ncbi:MAG TPA: sulfotransferase domain-containing protein, partial [Urbifossiella sp.]|nr:sulfotransferase domain-containing protein [Urbifossiella sp.]
MWQTRPAFLVISPPKTGSTWLADNLRAHPGVFVPAIKEVKYFSSHHRRLDLSWYLSHFVDAGGRLAGEASPSYAALPGQVIRRLRDLYPDLKLVFLMRDPVGRAWSHAKHTHHYREATFADVPPGPAADQEWRTAAADDWALLSGDYLGQLRRWAAVFPSEQLFVGFYEDIPGRPVDLFRRILRFLGADPGVDLAGFPVRDRILAGVPGDPPPAVSAFLRGLLAPRTAELAGFLRDRFGLELPAAWQVTLGPGPTDRVETPPMFARAGDDGFVAAVGAREEDFPTAYREVLLGYRGYDLVYYRGRLLALDPAACAGTVPGADRATLDRLLASGACLEAPSLGDLKERVTERLLDRMVARIAAAEAGVRDARAAADRAAAEAEAALAVLRQGSLARRVARRVRVLAGRVVTR